MKRTFGILLTIVLGAAVGIGGAAWQIRKTAWNPVFDQSSENVAVPATLPADRPMPKVRVPETHYRFGTLDISSTGSHDFEFVNEGKAPLRLTIASTSCRCTVGKLDRNWIPPGESTKVHVTWKPTESMGPYEQTAQIMTNDPDRHRVTLTISGTITMALQAVPAELVLSHMTTSERSTAEARLYCYLDEPLKVLGQQFSDPVAAPFCRVAHAPVAAGRAQGEAAGPQRPIGNGERGARPAGGLFRQRLTFDTNVAVCRTLTLVDRGDGHRRNRHCRARLGFRRPASYRSAPYPAAPAPGGVCSSLSADRIIAG